MLQMKDTNIEFLGDIPCDWEIYPARFAFKEVKDKNANGDIQKALQFKNGTIIPKKNFDAEDDDYVAETITNYTIVKPNTIMINGLNLNYDLKSFRIGLVKELGVITSAYLALEPNESKIMPEYANYLFKGYESRMAFHNMGAGIRKTLGYKEFKNQPILLPPMKVQVAIVKYLNEKCNHIDAVIEKTQASIEEYKVLKQTIITSVLTNGIKENRKYKYSGIDWIGNIPEDWSMGKIKLGVTKVGSGKTPKGGADVYSDEGVLFLRSQNVYDTGILLDDPTYISDEIDEQMKSTRVHPYDVLLNITGGSIGRCCIFPDNLGRANVNQHVSIIRVKREVFTPEYMHYYWMSTIGKTSIALYQTGGNREGMSADAIKNSPIMILPIEEQKEITQYLDSKCVDVDKLIEKKEEFLLSLENYKKSFIYEYATGKKEVPDCY